MGFDANKIMDLKISRILHAGYVFEQGDTQIVFDPIFENPFSKNCYAFPSVRFDYEKIKNLQFTAIFISHFHDDHCSLESLNLISKDTPIYLYCLFDEMFLLIRELGFKNIHALKINESVQIGSLEIIPRRALDVEVDSLFQIKAAGLNILNVVDSWIDEQTLGQLVQNGPWDMVLWPFQTLREIEVIAPNRGNVAPENLPSEWIHQLKALNPKYVVPSSCQFVQESWSWYNQALFPVTYQQFKKEISLALPNTEVIRMNPSVSIYLDKNSVRQSSRLDWIEALGDPNVDYSYQPLVAPPTTAELSKNFEPLTAKQNEKVLSYCQAGLLTKYNSLSILEETYFEKPRLWKLAVYDHHGAEQIFYYQIDQYGIAPSFNLTEQISWLTEIPIYKLHSALDSGEALTSLYIRINDTKFPSEIEKEIESVDITEDPLIRCLFNGEFGAYQKAQLRQIQQRS